MNNQPRHRHQARHRSQPQPQPQPYNQIRVLWTDEQCEYLLNQRMYRNDEYWSLSSRNRTEFWASIADKINNCFGTDFSWMQIKYKWKNLLREHLVYFMFEDILNLRNVSIYFDMF